MARIPHVDQAARVVADAAAAIAAGQLFERVRTEILGDVAHPDALYLALARLDSEAGRKAFLRAVQKSLEVASAST